MFDIIIDGESTGLGKQVDREDRLVEIGAVCLKDGKTVNTFQSYCNPGDRYFENGRAYEALRINKIDYEQCIKKAPSDEEVALRFKLWLSRYHPCTIYIYNRDFDMQFLTVEPWNIVEDDDVRYGPCILLHVGKYLGERGQNVWNAKYEQWKWMKLVDAARTLGIVVADDMAHSALYDAKLAAEVCLRSGLIE